MRYFCYFFLAVVGVSAQSDEAGKLNEQGLQAYNRTAYPEAEQLYQQAIAIWEKLGPEFELHLATTKLNLAQAVAAEGRRPESVPLLQESLAVFRRGLGLEHLRTLTALNMLAGTYLMTGDYNRAALLLEEALPVERAHFPNDVQLARTLGGLACIRYRNNRVEEALPLAEESLKIALKADGENSLDAALAYGNVAEGHRVAGRYARALPLYRKARAIYEHHLGPEHPRVATLLAQEGLVLMYDGKLAMAEQSLVRANNLLLKNCAECTYEHWVAETNLGLVRFRQGKYAEADRLFSEVLSLQEHASPQPSTDMAAVLQALSFVRQKEKRFDDAERLTRRAQSLLTSYR